MQERQPAFHITFARIMGDANDSNPIGKVSNKMSGPTRISISKSGTANGIKRKVIGENTGLSSTEECSSAISLADPIIHPPFIVASAKHDPTTFRIIDSPSEITTAARN